MLTLPSSALTVPHALKQPQVPSAKPSGNIEVKSTYITNMLLPRAKNRDELVSNYTKALQMHETLRQQKYPFYPTPSPKVISADHATMMAQAIGKKEAAIKALDASKFIDNVKTEAKETLGSELFEKFKSALRGDTHALKGDLDKNSGKGLRILQDLQKSIHREFGAESNVGKIVSQYVADAPELIGHLKKAVEQIGELPKSAPQHLEMSAATFKERQSTEAKRFEQRMASLPADSQQHRQALKALGEAQGKFYRAIGNKGAEIITVASNGLWPVVIKSLPAK